MTTHLTAVTDPIAVRAAKRAFVRGTLPAIDTWSAEAESGPDLPPPGSDGRLRCGRPPRLRRGTEPGRAGPGWPWCTAIGSVPRAAARPRSQEPSARTCCPSDSHGE